MVRTLELQRLDEYASLQKVASFATLVATYEKGKPMTEYDISLAA
jgi:DNA excision repair protein ERCC-2